MYKGEKEDWGDIYRGNRAYISDTLGVEGLQFKKKHLKSQLLLGLVSIIQILGDLMRLVRGTF